MNLRKSTIHDLNSILTIIQQAQAYLKEQGIDQWQNNYPNQDTIKNDINNGISYVLCIDYKIIATIAISFEEEKTYCTIYNGHWLTNHSYAVIHRVCVHHSYKGQNIASKLLTYATQLCLDHTIHSIRIDTHQQNLSMQNVLLKNKFHYCRDIFLEDSSKRIAFEKVLLE